MCVFLKNLFLNEIKIDKRVSLNLMILIVGSCLTIDLDRCPLIIKVVGNDTSSTVGKIWDENCQELQEIFYEKSKVSTRIISKGRVRNVRLKIKIPLFRKMTQIQ